MSLEQTITKLKEIIFLKKGTGQFCEVEEEALKNFEKAALQEASEKEALREKIEEVEKALKVSAQKRQGLKDRITDEVKAYQALVKKLFQEERSAEDLFEQRISFLKTLGMKSDNRSFKEGSIHVGSMRARWIDEEIDTLTEDFRRELIADNREYYSKLKPKRRRVQIRPDTPEFNMFQYEHFIRFGIPVPSGWDEMAMKHRKYIADLVRKRGGGI